MCSIFSVADLHAAHMVSHSFCCGKQKLPDA